MLLHVEHHLFVLLLSVALFEIVIRVSAEGELLLVPLHPVGAQCELVISRDDYFVFVVLLYEPLAEVDHLLLGASRGEVSGMYKYISTANIQLVVQVVRVRYSTYTQIFLLVLSGTFHFELLIFIIFKLKK